MDSDSESNESDEENIGLEHRDRGHHWRGLEYEYDEMLDMQT